MAGECQRQSLWGLPKDIREKSCAMPVKAHHEEMPQPLSAHIIGWAAMVKCFGCLAVYPIYVKIMLAVLVLVGDMSIIVSTDSL